MPEIIARAQARVAQILGSRQDEVSATAPPLPGGTGNRAWLLAYETALAELAGRARWEAEQLDPPPTAAAQQAAVTAPAYLLGRDCLHVGDEDFRQAARPWLRRHLGRPAGVM